MLLMGVTAYGRSSIKKLCAKGKEVSRSKFGNKEEHCVTVNPQYGLYYMLANIACPVQCAWEP